MSAFKFLIKVLLCVIAVPVFLIFGFCVWMFTLFMGPVTLIMTFYSLFIHWLTGDALEDDWDIGFDMLMGCFIFIPLTPIKFLFAARN